MGASRWKKAGTRYKRAPAGSYREGRGQARLNDKVGQAAF